MTLSLLSFTGPIIMLQLDNEAGTADPADPYVKYVVELAVSLDADLPFVWCDGEWQLYAHFNLSKPMVPAGNGNDMAAYCDQMDATAPTYPVWWTENEGWYHPWGSNPIDGGLGAPRVVENPNRTPQDVAMAVARFVARGGSFMNYYMYYGGQHFGNGAAAGVLNSYVNVVYWLMVTDAPVLEALNHIQCVRRRLLDPTD